MVEEPDPQDLLIVNGVRPDGHYLVQSVSAEAFARGMADLPPDPAREEAERSRYLALEDGVMKVIAGVDDTKLPEAGWGVVFSGREEHQAEVATIRERLQPLLDLRKAQAGDLYAEYTGRDGYRDESGVTWLSRHGVGSGSADPEQMPFYLLLVGGPEHIPFEFGHRIDLQRAVGLLAFDDVADYRRYADAVVAAETGGAAATKRLELFGPRNRGDRATSLSSSRLIAPLADKLSRAIGWTVGLTADGEATKSRLGQLVNDDTPALLMTASHGLGLDAGDSQQRARQGALICADWPGVGEAVAGGHAFAATDVSAGAALAGRMAVLFACYGGGTPALDDFAHRVDPAAPERIADRPFVAALAQRLLAGGMLAVIAHVDRAWSYSFNWPRAGSQTQVFQSMLRQLMNGAPVGVAFDDFNVRTGELAVDHADLLARVVSGQIDSYAPYAGAWTAATDARNYVVLGDPAARLNV